MDRDNRANRIYSVSQLPLLQEGRTVDGSRDVLLKLYDQTIQTWRELIGVRFKLLALVPSVSLLFVATLLANDGAKPKLPTGVKVFLCVLGLVITIGLFVYELRNSALHDDLISRGRKLEDVLGIDTGIFRGRLKAGRVIKHDTALVLLYSAGLGAWIGALIYLAGVSVSLDG